MWITLHTEDGKELKAEIADVRAYPEYVAIGGVTKHADPMFGARLFVARPSELRTKRDGHYQEVNTNDFLPILHVSE